MPCRATNPQIRRNLTPRQAVLRKNDPPDRFLILRTLREANRIPLELVAVYRCHIRRTHGPTLDGEYCSQKTGTEPVQVQTVVDSSLPLGPDRDTDAMFRQAASDKVSGIMDRCAPEAIKMTYSNSAEVADSLVGAYLLSRRR